MQFENEHIHENEDELMPSRSVQTSALPYPEAEGPDDEMALRVVSPDKQEDNSYESNQRTSINKKKSTRERPWKQANAYDAIQTDDIDICGVNTNVVSPPSKKSIAEEKKQDEEDAKDGVVYEDDDDDISYDASTAALPYPSASATLPVPKQEEALPYPEVQNQRGVTHQTDMDDIDAGMNSRWKNASSPQEVHDAHVKGISLAAERAAKKDLQTSFGSDDVDDDATTSSRKSHHDQVRMEALKLLELANSTGETGKYIVKDGFTSTGGQKFKSMKVAGREKSSAIRGLGLTSRKNRGQYDRMDMDSDVFTTNPSKAAVADSMDEIVIHDETDYENTDKKNSWGSRYSIDRHLRALHGGLTPKDFMSKMDKDHYNKVNQNTSANNMYKSSPHEQDEMYNIENGMRTESGGKRRLWYTFVENVKDTFANLSQRYEDSVSSQWRSANHSSPNQGIFTGVAMTNFLDRLSPTNRQNAKKTGGKNYWNNLHVMNSLDSHDLPDGMHFSSNDDVSYEKKEQRKKMFWLAVLLVTLLTIFSVIGTTVSVSSGRRGGGYISVGEEVRFFVTSDIPVNKADETKLSREIEGLHPRDGDFLIHLGDISSASTSLCTFSVYDDAAYLLKQSQVPVMVLPGDNDWNDCPMPEAAFDYWMDKLNRFEQNFDADKFASFPTVDRQVGRDENFAFLHKGVLFIAVHLVDGTVQSEREWSVRDMENLQWVEEQLNIYEEDEYRAIVMLGHAGYSSKVGDFFWPVMEDLKIANKPVLYLHANDGEGMIEYRPVDDFKKFTAVRLEKGSVVAPTHVTIRGGQKPFSFKTAEFKK